MPNDANIGLFGGTFNPIHEGHLRAAANVADILRLTRVIFIPSSKPPHKGLAEDVDAHHRLRMASLAMEADPRFSVSDIEVRRGGESFTLYTLQTMRAENPGAVFTFLIGADAWREIGSWHRVEEVLPLADWAVMKRPGFLLEDIAAPLGRMRRLYREDENGRLVHRMGDSRIFRVDIPEIDVSSSGIRAELKKGKSVAGGIPPNVEQYIRRNGLYGAS